MRVSGKTILVVDHDLSHRVLLQAVFQRHGATVLLAEDGIAARGQLARNPDVIILALKMPRMNGYEFIEHLRKDHPALLARTIVLTAVSSEVDVLFGNVPVVHKPFDLDKLVNVIDARLLGGPPAALGKEWSERYPSLRTKRSSTRTRNRAKSTGHRFSTDDARIAGRKGGEATSRDRAHMALIGSIGGRHAGRRRRRRTKKS